MRGGTRASILTLVLFMAATPLVTAAANPMRPLTNPVGSVLDEVEQRARNVIKGDYYRLDE